MLALFFFFALSSGNTGFYSGKFDSLLSFSTFELTKLKGHSSVWYFFQSNCPSCAKQAEALACLPKDIEILSIGIISGKKDLQKTAKKYELRGNVYYAGAEWVKEQQLQKTPTLLLIDSQGQLIQRFEHFVPCAQLLKVLKLANKGSL